MIMDFLGVDYRMDEIKESSITQPPNEEVVVVKTLFQYFDILEISPKHVQYPSNNLTINI